MSPQVAFKGTIWQKTSTHVVVGGIAVLVFAWIFWWPAFVRENLQDSARLNFSVHTEFQVDGTSYTGDAVWSMYTWIALFPTSAAQGFEVRGEAIALAGGGRNFYLLRREQPVGSGLRVGYFPNSCVPNEDFSSVSQTMAWLRERFSGPCELSQVEEVRLPMLVEIPDLQNPASLQVIPYELWSLTKGCLGICLRSLRVERTEAPITKGIEQRLEWLKDYTYGLTEFITGYAASSGRSVGVGVKLIDFSTELGNGKMYKP